MLGDRRSDGRSCGYESQGGLRNERSLDRSGGRKVVGSVRRHTGRNRRKVVKEFGGIGKDSPCGSAPHDPFSAMRLCRRQSNRNNGAAPNRAMPRVRGMSASRSDRLGQSVAAGMNIRLSFGSFAGNPPETWYCGLHARSRTAPAVIASGATARWLREMRGKAQ